MGGCTVVAKIKLMFCSLNYTQRPVFANAILVFGYVELYLLYMIHVGGGWVDILDRIHIDHCFQQMFGCFPSQIVKLL